jgi:hypothetical protein
MLVIAGIGALVVGGLVALAVSITDDDDEDELDQTIEEDADDFNDRLVTGTLVAPECGGGYDTEFANVTIRNERDEIIGAGNTSAGDLSVAGCEVTFAIPVDSDATFYSIRIGTHGGPTYSREEMELLKFNLSLELD